VHQPGKGESDVHDEGISDSGAELMLATKLMQATERGPVPPWNGARVGNVRLAR